MKAIVERRCERVAREFEAETGEWIYDRLAKAAMNCESSDLADIASAIDAEYDKAIDGWLEREDENGGYGFGEYGGSSHHGSNRGWERALRGARTA